MLEDDVAEVWLGHIVVGVKIGAWHKEAAHFEFAVTKGLYTNYGSNYADSCHRMLALTRARLIEVISSPIPYIREWGKIVQSNKETANEKSTDKR